MKPHFGSRRFGASYNACWLNMGYGINLPNELCIVSWEIFQTDSPYVAAMNNKNICRSSCISCACVFIMGMQYSHRVTFSCYFKT